MKKRDYSQAMSDLVTLSNFAEIPDFVATIEQARDLITSKFSIGERIQIRHALMDYSRLKNILYKYKEQKTARRTLKKLEGDYIINMLKSLDRVLL